MADVWLPGAYRDLGRNAGYNGGHNQMIRAVAHYTVGADSRSVGRNGYFHFLVHKDQSRENGCTQYAEINAVTWHAANQGNPYGPGIEWERNVTGGYNDEGLANAEPLTENQILWGERIVAFCGEWGIPATLWDGPRYGPSIMPGGGYRGWVNHHDIDQDRGDGLTRSEWATLIDNDTIPITDDEDQMIYKSDSGKFYQQVAGGYQIIDGASAYTLATGGVKVIEGFSDLAMLKMGLDAAKILQAAMKVGT